MIAEWSPPSGQGIRLDSHINKNYVVPPYYVSLLGKLIVSGHDRKGMLAVAASALSRFKVAGIQTTIPFHSRLLGRPQFIAGSAHTRWVEEGIPT